VCTGKLLEELAALKCSHLKVIRVYSSTLEYQIHPIPKYIPEGRSKERGYDITVSKCNAIALHTLIREATHSKSTQIKEYDQFFSDMENFDNDLEMDKGVLDAKIEAYENLIEEACKLELQACDVIFCTTICSASRHIITSTHVEQIIVDECGMCTEAETLVPISSYKDVAKVVLIGDHQQLQPIVSCYEAKRVLSRSLFERLYSKKETRLTFQYRMVSLKKRRSLGECE